MKTSHLGFVVAGVAVLMLGAAFAAKPIYDTFCKVTGYGGTTSVADARPDDILDRMMRVRLDANVQDLPFDFKPIDRFVDIHVGDTAMVKFEVTNTSDKPITAVAGYNVTPFKAGPYFTKLECFCFDEQVYQPGEKVILPVLFFVNPMIEDDHDLDSVKAITLSYTFYKAKSDNETLASLSNLVSEDN